MKTREVIDYKAKSRLCEIMQQNKTQFALCRYDEERNKIVQCHPFVHCRDFLLDALVGLEDNREISIYNFSYTTENPRPDSTTTSLLIRFADAGALKNFQDNFSILEGIESRMGFNHTIFEVVKYPDEKSVVLWAIGDARWQRATVLMSLYTYLLKCLTYQFKDFTNWHQEILDQRTVESGYMDKEHIDFLIDNAQKILDRYMTVSGFSDQNTRSTGVIHNMSGFVASKSAMAGKQGYEKHALFNMRKAA